MYGCNRADCDGATVLRESREADEANIVVEQYECEFGHISHESIEAAPKPEGL